MTPIVAAKPADLIALAWYQLGYRPSDSVLLVGLHGDRRRAGVVVRCDLPPPGAEAPVLLSMAGPLRRSGATAAVLLVCADGACRSAPHRVVRAARRLLPRHGLPLADALAVDAEGYRSYLCRRPACCPPQGRPLAEVLGSRVAAELVLEGRTLADAESGLIADVLPQGPPVPVQGGSSSRDRRDLLDRWRAELARPQPRSGLAAELARGLTDGRLRDAVMLTLVPGGDRLADELLAGAGGEALESTLATAPDSELLERGVRLLAAVSRSAPPGLRAGPLGALAWLAWWSGHGARARLLVEQALADQPGHRLAVLVDGLLELAVPPPWVAMTGC